MIRYASDEPKLTPIEAAKAELRMTLNLVDYKEEIEDDFPECTKDEYKEIVKEYEKLKKRIWKIIC